MQGNHNLQTIRYMRYERYESVTGSQALTMRQLLLYQGTQDEITPTKQN